MNGKTGKQKNSINKDKIALFIFGIAIFLFFIYFFVKKYPIILFDSDDWELSAIDRIGLPLWGAWNPIKILPESLFSVANLLASFFILPFTNDFLSATTITYAIIVSSFILMYSYYFIKVLKNKFEMPTFNVILVTIVFLLCHFWIYKSNFAGNTYMFYSLNATCYFHYIIPALLNSTLVLYYIDNYNVKTKKQNVIKDSILFLILYLAIFSNVFHSIILATFIASLLFVELIKAAKNNTKTVEFIKNNLSKIFFLIVWGISQIFEINGGRANSLSSNISFVARFKLTLKHFKYMITSLNDNFVIFAIVVIILTLILLIKNRKKKDNNMSLIGNIIFSGFFTTLYIILVCTCCGYGYVRRTDTIFGIVFYLFLLIFFDISYILKRIPRAIIVVPLIIFVIYTQTDNFGRTFKPSNMAGLEPEVCIEIDNYIIDQIIAADKENKYEVDLHIPNFYSEYNWPIATYSAGYVNTLYKNGIIKNIITINYVIDDNVNKMFGL